MLFRDVRALQQRRKFRRKSPSSIGEAVERVVYTISPVLDNNLTVACKQKAIRVLSIQKEGKKILKTKDFLTGYKIERGEKLA